MISITMQSQISILPQTPELRKVKQHKLVWKSYPYKMFVDESRTKSYAKARKNSFVRLLHNGSGSPIKKFKHREHIRKRQAPLSEQTRLAKRLLFLISHIQITH